MTLDGTYKVSIEMTARKQVEGLVATTKRLLGCLGGEMPSPPDMEEHIQSVVQQFREDQELFDSFTMTIVGDSITVRTGEGEMGYQIKQRTDNDESHLVLELDSDEMGEITWNITRIGRFLFIDSADGMSEYVFERC